MGDGATTAVVLAAIAVAVVFLVALARRLGQGPLVRGAWDDVIASAMGAARVIRGRPRVLWPAAVLAVIAMASWVTSLVLMARRMGFSPWGLALERARMGSNRSFSFTSDDLLHALSYQPGMVAHYLWASVRWDGAAAILVTVIAAAALLATLDRWRSAATARGAGPSSRLLSWLLAPCLPISALAIYLMVAWRAAGDRSGVILALFATLLIPAAAWAAAAAGVLFGAARRALAGEDPWAPSDLGWSALRSFRSLFWLSLVFSLFYLVVWLAMALWKTPPHGRPGPDYASLVYYWLNLLSSWAAVALVLAPVIIVSEGGGALEGARVALRAWWRSPYHLLIAMALGLAAMWIAGILSWALVRTLVGPAAIAVALTFAGLAIRAVALTWAAAVALLLWQRVRGQVMAPVS